MKRVIIAVATVWVISGTVTYGQCMGQYHAKWPEWIWTKERLADGMLTESTSNAWMIRRACGFQGVIPVTGLPIVLYRGSKGEENQLNGWQWWPFRWI